MRALLRRLQDMVPPSEVATARSPEPVGPIRVDVVEHRAFVAEKEVPLTLLEFALLVMLMWRAGQVLSRDQLLREIWGASGDRSRTLDTHIKRLREKLGSASDLLETVRGVGFRLRSSETFVTPIRFPPTLLRRLDRHTERLRREQPGLHITRPDVIRLLLERGLDAAENPTIHARPIGYLLRRRPPEGSFQA